jgi:hypothetical protein
VPRQEPACPGFKARTDLNHLEIEQDGSEWKLTNDGDVLVRMANFEALINLAEAWIREQPGRTFGIKYLDGSHDVYDAERLKAEWANYSE